MLRPDNGIGEDERPKVGRPIQLEHFRVTLRKILERPGAGDGGPFRRDGTRAAKEDAARCGAALAQIFPRAKARNRGHSSSWEGPRAPRSLPRRLSRRGTRNETLWGCLRMLGCSARETRLRIQDRLKANENRDGDFESSDANVGWRVLARVTTSRSIALGVHRAP